LRGYARWLELQREMAAHTVQQYVGVVRTTAKLAGGMAALLAVTEEGLSGLAAAWEAGHKTSAMRWRSILRSFFRYLASAGLREENPARKPRERAVSPQPAVQATELERARDRAILALLAGTALRPAELRDLKVRSCRLQGQVTVSGRRRILLNGSAARTLEEYLALQRGFALEPLPLSAESLLFVDRKSGCALPEAYFMDLVRRKLRLAELARRTAATV
jgi:site-specific recombinase XerD